MNKDIVKGDWKQLVGAIKHEWGRLTDDDLTRAEGDGEYLLGRLQAVYGLSKDKARRALRDLGYDFRLAERRAAADRRSPGEEPAQRSER